MSKEIARKPESYQNEALVLALMPALLEQHGMKFVDAKTVDG